jgi:hypothetical protein
MSAFRIYLVAAWAALLVLSSFVVARYGFATSFSDFFGMFRPMGWPAQYGADFLCHLLLACLWVGWRNGWTAKGAVFAFLAFMGGSLFTLAYLLVLLHLEKGDMRRVLLGVRAG